MSWRLAATTACTTQRVWAEGCGGVQVPSWQYGQVLSVWDCLKPTLLSQRSVVAKWTWSSTLKCASFMRWTPSCRWSTWQRVVTTACCSRWPCIDTADSQQPSGPIATFSLLLPRIRGLEELRGHLALSVNPTSPGRHATGCLLCSRVALLWGQADQPGKYRSSGKLQFQQVQLPRRQCCRSSPFLPEFINGSSVTSGCIWGVWILVETALTLNESKWRTEFI